MAKCPQCGYDVVTPSRFSVFAWRWLTCAHCKAGLALVERAPKLLFPVMVVFFALFLLVRPRPFAEGMVLGGYVMALLDVVIFWLWEVWHPKLKIRKRPKPEITLNLSLRKSENIKSL